MKAACCQMRVSNNLQSNMITARQMIKQAANQNADLVILPEMFCCPYQYDAFKRFAQPARGSIGIAMSALAKQYGVTLIAGTIPEEENQRIFNTCLIYLPNGTCTAKYRKLHLFDVALSDADFCESNCITPGDKLGLFDLPFGTIGVAICFDLRFPELFVTLASKGAKLIVVPSAFHPNTGKRDWEILLRARALDSQAFIAACSPSCNSISNVYGHSAILSPQGEFIGELKQQEGILICDIDLSQTGKIRSQLNLLQARRTDIYRL